MVTIKKVANGVRKTANKKRRTAKHRSNVSTVAKKVTNSRRRNGTTKAGALSYAKKNGLKLVSKTRNSASSVKAVANKKRRHHKKSRNGGFISRTANGMFGNTKETGKTVIATLGGLAGARIGASFATPIVARGLAMIGLERFASPITIAALSVFAIRPVAEKVGGRGAGNAAMVGGLSMAVMEVITQFLPSTSSFNPFAQVNTSPLVLSSPQAQAAQQVIQAGAIAGAQAGAQQAAATLSGVRPRGMRMSNSGISAFNPNRTY